MKKGLYGLSGWVGGRGESSSTEKKLHSSNALCFKLISSILSNKSEEMTFKCLLEFYVQL